MSMFWNYLTRVTKWMGPFLLKPVLPPWRYWRIRDKISVPTPLISISFPIEYRAAAAQRLWGRLCQVQGRHRHQRRPMAVPPLPTPFNSFQAPFSTPRKTAFTFCSDTKFWEENDDGGYEQVGKLFEKCCKSWCNLNRCLGIMRVVVYVTIPSEMASDVEWK